MITEYTVKIIDYPTKSDGYEIGIIEVFRDESGIDLALRFLSPKEQVKIYIPLGEDNNEGGSNDPRKLHWIEKDKILSITPSIEIKGGSEHFYITNNKVS